MKSHKVRSRGRPPIPEPAQESIRFFVSTFFSNLLSSSGLTPAELEIHLKIGDPQSGRKGESIRKYVDAERGVSPKRAVQLLKLSSKPPLFALDLHLIFLMLEAYGVEKFERSEIVELIKLAPYSLETDRAVAFCIDLLLGGGEILDGDIQATLNYHLECWDGAWNGLSPLYFNKPSSSPLSMLPEIDEIPDDRCVVEMPFGERESANQLGEIQLALRQAIRIAKKNSKIWTDLDYFSHSKLMDFGGSSHSKFAANAIAKDSDLQAWFILQFLIRIELGLEHDFIDENVPTEIFEGNEPTDWKTTI